MQISTYTPDLTNTEANRFWMLPQEVCRLAYIGDTSDPKVKKLLNTLSDRNHLPFVKSGTAKTSPRLYSLTSAIMLRIFWEITRDGRSYNYAEPVAQSAANFASDIISTLGDIDDFEYKYPSHSIVFRGASAEGKPIQVELNSGDLTSYHGQLYSLLSGYTIFSVVKEYADFWAKDLNAKGDE